MCLFNAQCPEQLASCSARVPNCEHRSSCWGGPSRAYSDSALRRRFPEGLFFSFFLFFASPQWRWSSRRQPSPLFTSRPRPLRQWRDSAAGPISSGRLPQDKCESSTSLFYQLIGLFLTCAYLARGSSQFLSLSIGARCYLSVYCTGFQASRFMAKKTDCAGSDDAEQQPCNV